MTISHTREEYDRGRRTHTLRQRLNNTRTHIKQTFKFFISLSFHCQYLETFTCFQSSRAYMRDKLVSPKA